MLSWNRGFAFVLMLSFITTFASDACPPDCRCSPYFVECVGKGLKTVPKGIKTTVRKINLANNPSIHIESGYFLQFKFLFILVLSNCNQTGPLYLPSLLREVLLDNNMFTGDALTKMFKHKVKLLRLINLENNRLQPPDVKKLLKVLPTKILNLCLSHNNVSELRRKDIGRFNELKELQVWSSSLKSIEKHALDNMTQLFALYMAFNQLTELPDGLFRYNKELSYLHLENNQLTTFNSTLLGFRSGVQIYLQNNSLTTVDLRETKATNIMLSDNKIARLSKNLLSKQSVIMELELYSNKIQFISDNTFDNVKNVWQLMLQDSNITSLPRDLFNGVSVSTLLLQRNQLSNLNGVFDNMKMLPNTLALSGNKALHYLNGSDLQRFPNTTMIYTTCDYLEGITDIWKLRAKVTCSPKEDLVINIPSNRGFACNGYQCQYNHENFQYSCTACRPGYFSDCPQGIDSSQCVECPPGSYYQDQSGSTTCKTCRPGQYVSPERSPGKDASDCETCPKGTNTTITAGTRACRCIHGYSRRYRFGPCEKCRNEGHECSQDYPRLQRGYWMTWQGTSANKYINSTIENNITNKRTCEHAYIAFIKNLDTTNNSYDRRTMQFNCQMPIPIKCPMHGSCLGGIQPKCSRGYTGALCAVCKREYRKEFNQCVKCPTSTEAVLQIVGYITVFIFFCVIISFTDTINIENEHHTIESSHFIDHRTLADILLSSMKILIGFYQVLFGIMHAFANAQWPASLKSALTILQYIQFEIIRLPSLKCIKPNWNIDEVTSFWIAITVIIVVPILSLMYCLLRFLHIHMQDLSPSTAHSQRFDCGKNCTKVVALFLFVTYPIISTQILQILPISCHSFCTAMKHGACIHSLSYLRSDYSVPCLGMDNHKSTLIAAYSSVIVPFGLPVVLLALLSIYAGGKQPMPDEPITDVIEDSDEGDHDCSDYVHLRDINFHSINLHRASNSSIMKASLRFVYENYHTKYWYWEAIEMIRKLFMTVAIVLNLINTKVGLSSTVVITMVFTIVHAVIKPLKSNFENATQLLSLILIPLNLAIVAVLQSRTQSQTVIDRQSDVSSLGVLLVTMNSILIILLLARIFVVIAKEIISRITRRW